MYIHHEVHFAPCITFLLPQHSVCSKAHLMGASIRKDMTSSVTHVVAYSVSGSKYKVLINVRVGKQTATSVVLCAKL